MPHFTLDLRDEFRAGVVDAVAGRLRRPGRRRTPASSATATCGSTRCSTWRSGSAPPTLATGHYARVVERRARAAAARPADAAKDQSYMLAGAGARVAGAAALPAQRADQGRGARDRAPRTGSPSPRSPSPRTSASSPAQGRSAFPAPPRRPRRPRGRDRRPSGTRARPPPRPPQLHGRPAPRDRRLGCGEPLYVLATDADANTVTVGTRERAAKRARSRSATRAAPRRRARRPRQAPLPLGALPARVGDAARRPAPRALDAGARRAVRRRRAGPDRGA